jgi:hypothetical protein
MTGTPYEFASLGVEPAEGFIEAAPVDQSGQPNQLMAHVDHVLQPAAEHVSFVSGCDGLGRIDHSCDSK